MLEVAKVLLVFFVILLLIRRKWNIGYVLTIASGLLAILYAMPVNIVLSTVTSTLAEPITIKLFFSLTLIRVFEMILREQEMLTVMTEALKHILKKRKAVIISMPMLIGLLPSLGGAYFSAPMVAESTSGLRMPQEEKAFINYWFRHPWEFILPLYPGILLAAAITQIELRSFIFTNSFYAILMILAGFAISMRGAGGDYDSKKVSGAGLFEDRAKKINPLFSFAPLISVFLLVAIFGLELSYSLAIVILLLLFFYKYRIQRLLKVFKYGFALEVIVLIFGTMLFKMTMENSGAVQSLSVFFSETGVPVIFILLFLPFVTGLLTGITVGFVGATFPLLVSLVGFTDLKAVSLAFVSGYVGVLLSPVHLCLVLTREYFKADMWGIYRRIISGCFLILALAIVVYLFL